GPAAASRGRSRPPADSARGRQQRLQGGLRTRRGHGARKVNQLFLGAGEMRSIPQAPITFPEFLRIPRLRTVGRKREPVPFPSKSAQFQRRRNSVREPHLPVQAAGCKPPGQ
ncbi:hypothetical protein H1C71_012541, partial [Ictidomys tridecemlineatus]